MKATIERIKNGWVMTIEDQEKSHQFCYGETELTSSVMAFHYLLMDLDEFAGPTTGKYDEERIFIDIKPGDEHESEIT